MTTELLINLAPLLGLHLDIGESNKLKQQDRVIFALSIVRQNHHI